LASTPNAENKASINAFSVGVKTVNPNAKVYVAYASKWNEVSKSDEAEELLIEAGVDLIANKVIFEESVHTELLRQMGVYAYLAKAMPISENTFEENGASEWLPLAASYWNWGVYYQKMVSSIVNHSYEDIIKSHASGSRLINFYWGMSSGILDLWISPEIPKQTNQLVRQMKRLLVSDSMSPFDGPLVSATGQMICEEESSLETERIIEMDWYYENVVVLGEEIASVID
jgi:basic membrane lipoprotein Med (substrate-binding protein (PBP1-ABC) superfamily)